MRYDRELASESSREGPFGRLGYGFHDVRFESLIQLKNRCSLIKRFHTAPESMQHSPELVTWSLSTDVKRRRREANHSTPYNSAVGNARVHTFTPQRTFRTLCFN